MNLNFLKKLLIPDIRKTIIRFPFSVILTMVLAILLLAGANGIDLEIIENSFLYLFSICGFFSYLSLKLFAENHNLSKKSYIILFILVSTFLSFFCSKSWGVSSLFGLFSFLLGVFLFLSVSPYCLKKIEELTYYTFNIRLLSSIFFAFLSTLIICTGLSIVLFSIQYLFDMEPFTVLYKNMWIVAISFFAPFYMLANIPRDFDGQQIGYSKKIGFLFSYIIAPLLTVYFLILYAYISVILFTWNLPKGKVAYMVIALGVFGTLLHLFAVPLKDSGSKLIKFIYKYFYYAMLPPLALLFVGIYVRISDYGITEHRYLVVLLALWLFVSVVYSVLNIKTKSKTMLLTLSCMLILASFGPWGASDISSLSQSLRLKSILIRNKIIVDGTIKKKVGELSPEDKSDIDSIVTRLVKGKQTKLIKNWFSEDSYLYRVKKEDIQSLQILSDMGVDSSGVNRDHLNRETKLNISLFRRPYENTELLPIDGFDFYSELMSIRLKDLDWSREINVRNQPNKDLKIYTEKNGILKVKYPSKNISLYFDIQGLIQALYDQGMIKDSDVVNANAKLFSLTKEEKGLKVRLLVRSISGKVKDDKVSVSYADLDLAVKYPKN